MMTEFVIEKYEVQSTGADGGHHYILTEIEYKGKKRRLLATFIDKSDEMYLKENVRIKIKGELFDEGENFDLTLLNTTIEK